jgi:hypothetical protein
VKDNSAIISSFAKISEEAFLNFGKCAYNSRLYTYLCTSAVRTKISKVLSVLKAYTYFSQLLVLI